MGAPHCFWDAYLKSSSVDDSEIGETYYNRTFSSVNLCSSTERWDHGPYMYGRIYIYELRYGEMLAERVFWKNNIRNL